MACFLLKIICLGRYFVKHLIRRDVFARVVGIFTLPVAVLGHELSELAVIGSGLRMLRG